MLTYPYDGTFQRQQPLVMLEDGTILAMTGTSPAVAVLQTAAGVQHGLGLLGQLESLWKVTSKRLVSQFESVLIQELPRRVAELRTDAVAFFAYLANAFEQRDFSEAPYATKPLSSQASEIDWTSEIAQAVRQIPRPQVPLPSLWMLGRVWQLRERGARNGCWHIHSGDRSFSLNGEFTFVATLAAQWQVQVARFVAEVAARLAAGIGECDDACNARQELSQRGWIQRGDLILVSGNPPVLGHIIPVHYNRTLGRSVNRDLAITTPLTLPLSPKPSRSAFAIHERGSSGLWSLVCLPNGLCLGGDPPSYPQESAGVGLAALLRWAAQILASNGIFHSSDDSSSATDNDYQY